MKDYSISELRAINEAYWNMLVSESSSSDVEFRFVSEEDAKRIISSMSRRADNERLNLSQFRKYFKDPKKRWFGMFVKGKVHVPFSAEERSKEGYN